MGSFLTTKEPTPDPLALTILCFGDSLTKGFYKDWDNWYKHPTTGMPCSVFYSPYSNTLESLILKNCNIKKKELNIISQGENGQCAINMIDRLNKCFYNKFDLVIICAGTNDIALVKDRIKIINSIVKMHQLCHQNGCKTVVVTIPECEKQNNEIIQKRNFINNNLKKFANDNKDKAMLFDLNGKLKYHTLNDKEKELYWNDGLHLTPKGYEYWGLLLYEFLLPWITDTYKNKLNLLSNV